MTDWSRGFASVQPTDAERAAVLPGDDVVPDADSVMDRAFSVAGTPEEVWPWLVQLGKARAGWYLRRRIERLLPRGRRATRRVEPQWQHLAVGDVIPDYGGKHETFTVEQIDPPHALVYWSQRGKMRLTWAIVLTPEGTTSTRLHFRLRLGPIKRQWLADTVGELFDGLTIAGVAAGLRERLANS